MLSVVSTLKMPATIIYTDVSTYNIYIIIIIIIITRVFCLRTGLSLQTQAPR